MTTAVMETDAGTIELELFDDDAPGTVANFVKLAKEGFYDGLAFHRVIPGFMAQGGCPNSRAGARGMAGTGGPGYQIDCEINSQKHQTGTLAMAHAGRNTGGSQFYICFEPQPHLDGQHTVFGHTDDMDVVLKLRNGSRINKVMIKPVSAIKVDLDDPIQVQNIWHREQWTELQDDRDIGTPLLPPDRCVAIGACLRQQVSRPSGLSPQQLNGVLLDILGSDTDLLFPLRDLLSGTGFIDCMAEKNIVVRRLKMLSIIDRVRHIYSSGVMASVEVVISEVLGLDCNAAS